MRNIKKTLYHGSGYGLAAHLLDNNDLLLVADEDTKQMIKEEIATRSWFEIMGDLLDPMLGNGFDWLSAEDIGALTGCELILGFDLDREAIKANDLIWWLPIYQIHNELEKLLENGELVLSYVPGDCEPEPVPALDLILPSPDLDPELRKALEATQ